MKSIIKSDRLFLRKLDLDDIYDLFEFFCDTEAMKYLPGTKNLNEIKQWLSIVFESYRKMNFGPWAVISKGSNLFIGYCGLYLQYNVDDKDEVEILYGLKRKYWGNGYATEAAVKVYEYGKTTLKIKKFISIIAPDNYRSSKVAKKIGMHLEKETIMWGKNHYVYSIG